MFSVYNLEAVTKKKKKKNHTHFLFLEGVFNRAGRKFSTNNLLIKNILKYEKS